MKSIISSALFILYISSTAFCQRFDNVTINAEKLTDNIYMLTGDGGNIGLFIGKDGVFMIDDQYAPLSEKIQIAISKITDQPVRFLVNTHWHGDHSGGNENFAEKGAILIAHKNVRKRMSSEQTIQAFSRTVPASPAGALPEITFTEDISFHLNGEDVIVFHVHNAHTDGDGIVYFPKSNVIHMGDTYFKGRYPFIDVSSGGSIDGIIKAANQVLFLANDDTKIIPGHGPVSNKKELAQYRDMLMAVRDRVKQALQAGLTFEEIKAAKLTKDYDDPWGKGFIKPEKLASILYSDLTREEK